MRMYASHSATGDPTESQTINFLPPAFHAIVTLLPHSFAEVFLRPNRLSDMTLLPRRRAYV